MKGNIVKNTIRLVVFLNVLLIIFILLSTFKESKKVIKNDIRDLTSTKIEESNRNYYIRVKYPTFKDKELNKVNYEFLNSYLNLFKQRLSPGYNKLYMSYSVSFLDDVVIVNYHISNSLNKYDVNRSLIIDINSKEEISFYELIGNKTLFKRVVNSKIDKKYSTEIANELKKFPLEKYSFYLDRDKLTITFNTFRFRNINFVPNISFKAKAIKSFINKESDFVFSEYKNVNNQSKYIAFTYDDGPSNFTNGVIDALEENDSKATFFILGLRAKYRKPELMREISLGHEVGNHSYNHKQLTKLKPNEIDWQLNTTNLIYNNATGRNLTLLRVPYGSVNKKVKARSPYPIIMWNIDTLDWHYLDAKKISNHILKKARDGDIVLMHDVNHVAAEATRIVIPELQARGFKIVTVSELARIKGTKLQNGKVYRYFK